MNKGDWIAIIATAAACVVVFMELGKYQEKVDGLVKSVEPIEELARRVERLEELNAALMRDVKTLSDNQESLNGSYQDLEAMASDNSSVNETLRAESDMQSRCAKLMDLARDWNPTIAYSSSNSNSGPPQNPHIEQYNALNCAAQFKPN